jgi:hypothetical protein
MLVLSPVLVGAFKLILSVLHPEALLRSLWHGHAGTSVAA